jgi:hypothetical protein
VVPPASGVVPPVDADEPPEPIEVIEPPDPPVLVLASPLCRVVAVVPELHAVTSNRTGTRNAA